MLRTRVASAAVFGPLLVAAGYFGGLLLWLVTAAVIVIGLLEMDKLLTSVGPRAWPALTIPFGLALLGLAVAGRFELSPLVLTLLVLVSIMAPALAPVRLRAWDGVAAVFAVLYIAWLASHFVLLRTQGGLRPFFVGLVGTWVFDCLSYFAGKAWGKHKLTPRVSPGKSVEGLVGGIIGGGVALVWLGLGWLGLGWLGSVVLAVVVMAAAQLGDLAESALKRQAGVKDSGTLIPGHGGVMDRFDSLLAVMPAVYYLWVLWLGA